MTPTPHTAHRCQPLTNTSAKLPDDVSFLWWGWRCPICKQRWTIKENGGGDRSASAHGTASRRWRRDAWRRSTIAWHEEAK